MLALHILLGYVLMSSLEKYGNYLLKEDTISTNNSYIDLLLSIHFYF